MTYLVTKNAYPLLFVNGGKSEENKNFKHEKRCIDTFVVLFCVKGPIYIAQDSRRFILEENQYLLLFSDHEHYGYKESNTPVSYYWCHFKVSDNNYQIVNHRELTVYINSPALTDESISQYYLLPEHGDLSGNTRALLMFRQLLDISRNSFYTPNLPNYALSLLAMEISQEFIELNFPDTKNKKNVKLDKVIEWIRINYNLHLTLEKIGKRFNFNPDYLSTNFRKYKGVSLMKYILLVRIAMAKNLLLNSSDSIKEIAYRTGFRDERVFMKQFKKLEDTTPTKYRYAFSRVKLVKTAPKK